MSIIHVSNHGKHAHERHGTALMKSFLISFLSGTHKYLYKTSASCCSSCTTASISELKIALFVGTVTWNFVGS